MSTILSIAAALLLLSILVTIHEFGHYWAGRRLGFTIVEFAVGMGPVLLKKTKNGIQYSLRALPIGGVKEKLLAAYRAGVTEILLPRENGRDLEKIDGSIREKLHITLLDDVDEAVALILQPGAEVKVAV